MTLPKIFTTSHLYYFSFLKSPKGFTLIELLIVIAMIVILISVGFASFTRAQKNARDTQRKQDLSQVKTALEQYFELNKSYPAANAGKIECGTVPDVKDWGLEAFSCVDGGQTQIYMRVLPDDPSGSASYPEYCYTSTGPNNFSLYTQMENDNNANIPVEVSNPGTCSGDYDYQLSEG